MVEARQLVESLKVQVLHIFREGNLLADALANTRLHEEGKRVTYNNYLSYAESN